MESANTPSPTLRLKSRTRGLLLVFAALAAFVGYAGWREAQKSVPVAAAHTDAHAFAERRPAQSPAEERFAQALWNVHSEVRTAAVRMTFAGLSYKIGDADRASVNTKVAPLTVLFSQAEADLRKLDTPASMQELRERYALALQLYRSASVEMVKVVQDGNDAHLLQAQEMSERASGILLEVGEQLWPGEIKPN